MISRLTNGEPVSLFLQELVSGGLKIRTHKVGSANIEPNAFSPFALGGGINRRFLS